jgi:hypothetical protein
MATKEENAVVASVTEAPASPRRDVTLVSISEIVKQNRLADGTMGASYHVASFKLDNGKVVNGTIPVSVVAKGIELNSKVTVELGMGSDNQPILRALGVATERASWADFGLDTPTNIEDAM